RLLRCIRNASFTSYPHALSIPNPLRYHSPKRHTTRHAKEIMYLTLYTDYSLRTLMFLATVDRSSTISEVADAFHISRNHLVKVVHHLAREEFILSTRGKSGGITLARSPRRITVGDVVRAME